MSKINIESNNYNSNYVTCESSPQSQISYDELSKNKRINEKEEKENFEIYLINQNFKALKVSDFISEILLDISKENSERKFSVIRNSFYIKNPPNMPFLDFTRRVVKFLKPEISTLIISLIYIDLLLKMYEEELFLTENNIYKIFFTSIVLAMKYNEDNSCKNDIFGKVGGISIEEINNLERDFLILIDYRLYISEDLYKLYEPSFVECK
jgi:hypothetical protein